MNYVVMFMSHELVSAGEDISGSQPWIHLSSVFPGCSLVVAPVAGWLLWLGGARGHAGSGTN